MLLVLLVYNKNACIIDVLAEFDAVRSVMMIQEFS